MITSLARSPAWLYIEIPAGTVVHDAAGVPMTNPPQRGWIHQSTTNLGGGGGEAFDGPPSNEGADELAMPGTPPGAISAELRFGMSGPEVQQAKVKLVQRRYMTTSEYRRRGEDFYSNWTTEAVRSFQLIAMPTTGLQDGVLSPAVWRALFQSASPQAHRTRTEIEGLLAGIGTGSYQWDDRDNNVYAFANYGSASYWGPDLPGGECTWFARSVLTRLPFRLGAGTWAGEAAAAGLVQPSPAAGNVMNQGTHLAIVTAVHGEGAGATAGATIDVIESNWNYSRAVGTRTGLPIAADMVFIRQP